MTMPPATPNKTPGWWTAIETKVKASTTAATITGAVTAWITSNVLPPADAPWLSLIIGGVVTGALTFLAGWMTRHTPRDL